MAHHPIDRQRRRLLLAGSALALAGSRPAFAAPKTVSIVTSYPDEFVTRIQAAFEKARPDYRMQVIWRMPQDAYDYLKQATPPADVYWAASPRTFARLAADGIWQKLPVHRSSLPERIGNAQLGDGQGFYTATEVAGFGFAVSPKLLAAHQLPVPADWSDLADPRLAGLIALPDPSRVGFAPPMIEIVLQALGWERGWALWSEISANASFIERGSTFVTDEIVAGRCAVGLSIDFFVNAAIANGAPLRFVYPAHTGLNPAHVAVAKAAPNPEGAKAFVDFILSRDGQRQLAHPDIRRLPIRPDAYADQPAGSFNPFAAAQAGGLQFDSDAARPRLATSSALFHQMLVEPHGEITTLWRRLQRAEAAGKKVAAIRARLGAPAIAESVANDPAVQRQIGPRLEGNETRPLSPVEIAWRDACRAQRAEVDALLKEVGA